MGRRGLNASSSLPSVARKYLNKDSSGLSSQMEWWTNEGRSRKLMKEEVESLCRLDGLGKPYDRINKEHNDIYIGMYIMR